MENITKNNIKSGIYAIINTVNGKRYIGSAVNLRKRKAQHKLNLNKGIHQNIILQNAWNKHGSDNFIFVVLEYCSSDTLLKKEQHHIDTKADYNICPTAGNTLGMKHTEEAKEKIKESKRNLSAEARARMVAAHKGTNQGEDNPCFGRKHTPEECAKISAAQVGKRYTWRGRNHSVESKLKMSESAKGKIVTLETCKKMSESHKGIPLSPEQRERISKGLKGRVFSQEHRENIRIAALNRQERIASKPIPKPNIGAE